MSNKNLNISKEGKDLLEEVIAALDLERPHVIKLSLAKGIASKEEIDFDSSSTPKWKIPDNLIKDKEYLMFKHLILSKNGVQLEDNDIQNQMVHYIEKGIRSLKKDIDNKNSLEDSRFVII